jgi:hypothetical protein
MNLENQPKYAIRFSIDKFHKRILERFSIVLPDGFTKDFQVTPDERVSGPGCCQVGG